MDRKMRNGRKYRGTTEVCTGGVKYKAAGGTFWDMATGNFLIRGPT